MPPFAFHVIVYCTTGVSRYKKLESTSEDVVTLALIAVTPTWYSLKYDPAKESVVLVNKTFLTGLAKNGSV